MKTWPYSKRLTIWHGTSSQWVSVVFPIILVHNKSFLSTFYQLIDKTPKRNRPVHGRICPVRDTIYAKILLGSKKYLGNIKRTLNNHFEYKYKRVPLSWLTL